MPEWLTQLVSSPLNLGVIVGILALLVLGKNAPLPLLEWLKKLVPSTAGTLHSTGTPSPEDDCVVALQCLMAHAIRANNTELLTKLIDVVGPVNKLHESSE